MARRRSFDQLLLRTVDESIRDVRGEAASKELQFFVDTRIALDNPDGFANSLRGVFGREEGDLLIGHIEARIQEQVDLRATAWQSFTEFLEDARRAHSHPFTNRLGIQGHSIAGRTILLEVDPSTSFERAITEYVHELSGSGHTVSAITFKGSPVYNVVSAMDDVAVYSMTSRVTFPKNVEGSHETLVPRDNQAVLLNILDKVANSASHGDPAIVLDNLSILIVYFGAENFVKFIMQANELLTEGHVSSLLLVISGAQEGKQLSLIRSFYPDHLAYGSKGLILSKTGMTGRTEEFDDRDNALR